MFIIYLIRFSFVRMQYWCSFLSRSCQNQIRISGASAGPNGLLVRFSFFAHEVSLEIERARHNGKTRTVLRVFFVYLLRSGSAKEAGDVGGIIT